MALNRNKVTYSARPTHAARSAHAKGDKQFRTYDTSYIVPKRTHKGIIAFGVALALLAIVLLFMLFTGRLGGFSGSETAQEVLPADQEVTFIVEEGESAPSVAQSLYDAKLIATRAEFSAALEAAEAATKLKPGTYTVTTPVSAEDLVELLVSGPVMPTFTVPEGFTIERTAAAVEQAYAGQVSADEFLALARNASAFAAEFPFVAEAYNNSLEGFLFPKTYVMSSGDTAESIIRRMLSQYAAEVATLDYSYASEQGLSAYDVLKLASIIEREADDATNGKVASVFYNRLEEGMRLQSDATVAYFAGHDPTSDDVQEDNPYNTYTNDGLTPGPICSPGLAALQAACQPDDTSYLYFYFEPNASGTGTDYYFSETFEEHQAAYNGESEPNA